MAAFYHLVAQMWLGTGGTDKNNESGMYVGTLLL